MVTVPRLLSDIITRLVADRVILDLVGEFDSRAAAENRLSVIVPDLVLVGLRDGESDAIGRRMLALVPSGKVIALSSDCRNAYLHEMRARRVAITDVSPKRLINAILGAPGRRV